MNLVQICTSNLSQENELKVIQIRKGKDKMSLVSVNMIFSIENLKDSTNEPQNIISEFSNVILHKINFTSIYY